MFTLDTKSEWMPFQVCNYTNTFLCQNAWESPGYSKTHSVSKVSIGQVKYFSAVITLSTNMTHLAGNLRSAKVLVSCSLSKVCLLPYWGWLDETWIPADLLCTSQSKLCKLGRGAEVCNKPGRHTIAFPLTFPRDFVQFISIRYVLLRTWNKQRNCQEVKMSPTQTYQLVQKLRQECVKWGKIWY